LPKLAGLSGGRVFFPDQTRVHDIMTLIHTELRNQYLLGYVPTNKTRNGKWRKITIKINPPPGFPKMAIRAKPGYFAPKD
jgi:Ca-activated chloride channel homolog